jgi:hypothetical protein
MQGLRSHLTYANVISTLCLFLLLAGGTAYAANTIGSSDIIDESILSQDIKNAEVKVADIGQGAVATDEIANGQVKTADIGAGEVRSGNVANGQVLSADIGTGEVRSSNVANDNLTGGDIAGNSLKGADIDEGTLDVGDAARAYGDVSRLCSGDPGAEVCEVHQSKGITSVIRKAVGVYCVRAPGINPSETSAVVSTDWNGTNSPEGNASVFVAPFEGCANGGFGVYTYFAENVGVVDSAGTPRTVQGASGFSNEVGFTIVIP